jgi:hypothetical protein
MTSHETTSHRPEFSRSRFRSFLMRDWPYLFMLVLALAGVARTSVDPSAMTTYWVTLAPVFGIICVAVDWRDVEGPEAHWHLVRTQALHWTAVMFTMYLVFMTSVNRIMNSDADALTVLAVLVLGTVTAGIHAEAWRISVVGAVLGLAIPAIAWLETSTVLILLVLVVLITAAVLVFLHNPASLKKRTGSGSPSM